MEAAESIKKEDAEMVYSALDCILYQLYGRRACKGNLADGQSG